ncbi:YihY/virulence factor BrkB family protein [Blastopirellula marina]|nr:YhjD/YihY/BrkB family envelope integrity protein [Blastopirellula marina]
MFEPWKTFCSRFIFRWVEYDHSTSAAAIAFYVIFSLAPILVFSVTVAGEILESEPEARQAAIKFLNNAIGETSTSPEAAFKQALETIDHTDAKPEAEMAPAEPPPAENEAPENRSYGEEIVDQIKLTAFRKTGFLQSSFLILVALWSASATFMQLRNALNRIYGFTADGLRGSLIAVALGRLRATLFSIGVGLLLALATLLSTWSHALWEFLPIGRYITPEMQDFTTVQVISWITVVIVFYCMLRFLPMERPPGREVFAGAIIATIMFQIGKYLINMLAEGNTVAAAYVTSRVLVITVMWIFLSAHVLLFAAEVGHMLYSPIDSPFDKYRKPAGE